MIREIRFRAWDSIEQKMWMPIVKPDGRLMASNQLGGYVTFGDPQDPLMQYTGLNDKNGKPVYESDIIKGRLGKRHFIVRYIIDGWCLDAGETPRLHDYIHKHGEVEVIGNIYQDSHLLDENP